MSWILFYLVIGCVVSVMLNTAASKFPKEEQFTMPELLFTVVVWPLAVVAMFMG